MIQRFLIGFVFAGSMLACSDKSKKVEYLDHVGNTVFNVEIDTTDFEPCHDDQILEYYNFSNGLQYEGEKLAIDKIFKDQYMLEAQHGQTGYLTIRFVVNCKSETGWFRVESMNNDYQPTQFDDEIVNQLLNITKSLKGWKIAKFDDPGYENEIYDYYQYLTFKLKDGQILEILP